MEKKEMGNGTKSTAIPLKKRVSLKEKIKKLPEKKPHLDFIAAVLTIPLLAVTLYLNLANLKSKNTPTPAPTSSQNAPVTIIERNTIPQGITPQVITTTPKPTDTTSCIQDIGPIDISSPSEGQTVTTNPVCIDINYNAGNYCSVVWAYSINGGPLSDYSNNSVCLYNLPSGNNTFTLQVKSLSSASTKTLHRNFIYSPSQTTASPTQTVTPASTVTPGK